MNQSITLPQNPTDPELRACTHCGNPLGKMVTAKVGSATLTILKAGGMNIYDLNQAECNKCGAPVYHSAGLQKLLELLKLTGREVNIDELNKINYQESRL